MSDTPNKLADITSVTEQVGVGATGQTELGYRIYFTTAKGGRGSVFASKLSYNDEEAVRQMVRDAAAKIDALTGSSV